MTRKHLNFPPPPVPRTVRELLKDYPELIEELQDGLTKSHYGPLGALSFDSAIWLLEGTFDAIWGDADKEAEQATAQRDSEAAEQAKRKRVTISKARRSIHADDDLWNYFKTYEKDFQ